MKILVLNSGSSSLKFQLVAMPDESLLAKGAVDRIGTSAAVLSLSCNGSEQRLPLPGADHHAGVEAALRELQHCGAVRSHSEISGVGHRVVHGGESLTESVVITPDVERAIEDCARLAPLHNPANLMGYRASRAILDEVPHVAVFDTAFHATLPPEAYLYALPYADYTGQRIRRYGFHGTSHRFVTRRYVQLARPADGHYRLINCHLGNGSSLCAVRDGRSVDTSMGLTPLEGLVMGTRCGDIDPAAVLFLLRSGLSVDEVDRKLNNESGLLGVSGLTNDMRELEQAAVAGDARAALAISLFVYRLRHYIGAYVAALGGLDALVFTGGIGQYQPSIRASACEGLDSFGIRLDPTRNDGPFSEDRRISAASSDVEVWVIGTNEELLIARDTARFVMALPLP